MSEPIRMDGQYQTRDGREVELWKIEDRVYGRMRNCTRTSWIGMDWTLEGRGSCYDSDLLASPPEEKQ